MQLTRSLRVATLLAACLMATHAIAQLSGPTPTGRSVSVAQAREARVGSFVTVTGNIVNHLREEYYTFRDGSGEIRAEIASGVWQNRKVEPATKVCLLAEVDSGNASRYLYVNSLEVLN